MQRAAFVLKIEYWMDFFKTCGPFLFECSVFRSETQGNSGKGHTKHKTGCVLQWGRSSRWDGKP